MVYRAAQRHNAIVPFRTSSIASSELIGQSPRLSLTKGFGA
jgi:hypothetical protein